MLMKPIIKNKVLEKNIDIMVKMRITEKAIPQMELLKSLGRDFNFWTDQAFQLVQTFDQPSDRLKAIQLLFNKVQDRHLRFKLLEGLNEEELFMARLKMGDALGFTYHNPSGHYKLNLASSVQREIALSCMLIN